MARIVRNTAATSPIIMSGTHGPAPGRTAAGRRTIGITMAATAAATATISTMRRRSAPSVVVCPAMRSA